MVALILALLEDSEHATKVRAGLQGAGYHLVVVDTFAEAMKSLKTDSFDLIISDVHLENGGNVFDFLKWTKNQKQSQLIPFVLFSLEPTQLAKYLADGVQTTGRVFGAAKYITMEVFDAAAFADAIAELLPRTQDAAKVLSTEGE